ncbi:putative ABC transporter, substrate binding protein [Sulfurimonas gotlandica GD1]|uniref:Putative ABC transporter, substrate binding protein n=1 Tax=Sulfurimonas gotlandica (strain DSM 19862 / JCM 16533 / GD1) TaxID=929558 RepID=B6BIB1_SULGG|nr:ABC transporter substrate binding protein [Sulfurimonas gotlandica]EDZ63193.1 conserved hypothetical protein [Sulfurimonas gotlandica GD1]EHP30262.1 putative ABC transporter, substrate binding protein [Sulfurimonas gotlandica GD1]
MRLLFLLLSFMLLIEAQEILVINSNAKIEKYKEAQEGFSKSINRPFKIIDIAQMKSAEIKEYLYNEYPDIVYAIGAKAYQYANQYIPEKKIYFSSIMNWKRLKMSDERNGISHELHSEMHLILIKSIFRNIKTVGIIYSKYTEDVMLDFAQNARKLGIEIVSYKVNKESVSNENFDELVKHTESMIILPDPILLSDDKIVKKLFKLSKEYKKPVFAYHELFIEYGAALITSVDNPTIGRQIAAMINAETKIQDIKEIQYPAGTKVLFNKKVVLELGIEYSDSITAIATEVIE